MLDFGALGEILIIAVAILVLFGPKELPVVLRFCGRMIQKVRQATQGVRSHMTQYVHEGEMEEYDRYVKKHIHEQDTHPKP